MRKFILALVILMSFCRIADAANWAFLRYREHATDCTSLTDGGYFDVCRQLSDNNWYACYPTTGGVNGTCTSPGEWQLIVANAGSWSVLDGNIYSTDYNANVGIGTNSPAHTLQVIGTIESNQEIQVNGDPLCRLSGTNCPSPIFFNPANYGTTTFGSGSAFDWTMYAGATSPILSFSNGMLQLKQSGFKVYGTTSGILFGNGMYIRGNQSRKVCLGSSTATNNEIVCADNDTVPDVITMSTPTNVGYVNLDTIGVKTTSNSNAFGNVSIGTFNAGSSVATIAGNVSIGTSNFNKAAPTNGMLVQGNVGIGTTTVLKEFQVHGDAYFSKTSTKIYTTKPDGSCCYISADNSNALTCTSAACP